MKTRYRYAYGEFDVWTDAGMICFAVPGQEESWLKLTPEEYNNPYIFEGATKRCIEAAKCNIEIGLFGHVGNWRAVMNIIESSVRMGLSLTSGAVTQKLGWVADAEDSYLSVYDKLVMMGLLDGHYEPTQKYKDFLLDGS